MTAEAIALFLAFLAGYLARSQFARVEQGRQVAELARREAGRARLQQRVRELWGLLAEADKLTLSLREDAARACQPGGGGWLCGALQAVRTEMLEGERPVKLAVRVADPDGGLVRIMTGRDGQVERALLITVTGEDGHPFYEAEVVELPDTAEGLTG